MIIVSDLTKQLILLEFTVPWEERKDEVNERKRGKYQELVEECRSQAGKLAVSLWRSAEGICRAIPLERVHNARHHQRGKEEGDQIHNQSCRESH